MELDLEDGRREAERLVAVAADDVPDRHRVVGGGAEQLVAVAAPAVNTQTNNSMRRHDTASLSTH